MVEPANPNVTRLLERARHGDAGAMQTVLDLLYEELRGIARQRMGPQAPAQTLQPTALVHEAFLRLVDRSEPYESRGHFLGIAAQAMRSILVDHARARSARKRGGDRHREPFDEALAWFESQQLDLLVLDEALQRLAAVNERAARVVEMKYFAGLDHGQIATSLGLSTRSVERTWALARGWLHRALGGGTP
jgi:RNA polymerase sigma factor (TIGR02999 family)